VGAYVDEGTMIDSHALVGSCAQIGKRVHLSAAAQIGGVLEPVGALPVIVEDDVLVGGGCGIYEGTIVRQRAVLAAGTILTGSTAVYDVVREQTYRRSGERPLEIPAGAVVVPGARAVAGPAAARWGLSLYAPVIVKYRDEKTDAATLLEEGLRGGGYDGRTGSGAGAQQDRVDPAPGIAEGRPLPRQRLRHGPPRRAGARAERATPRRGRHRQPRRRPRGNGHPDRGQASERGRAARRDPRRGDAREARCLRRRVGADQLHRGSSGTRRPGGTRHAQYPVSGGCRDDG